jgi:hypothetical protein
MSDAPAVVASGRSARLLALALGAAVVLAGAVASCGALNHDDLFWHLGTGKIVLETGVVPTRDPFSYTCRGCPWTSHEWGFGLASYLVYLIGDYGGLIRLEQIVVGLVLLVVWAHMRMVAVRRDSPWIPALLLCGFVAVTRANFVLGAALFTTLFLALLTYLMRRMRQGGGAVHWVALWLLFVVWANVHAMVVFGLFAFGLHAIEMSAGAWLRQPSRGLGAALRAPAVRTPLLALGATAVSTLVLNPNGIEQWLYPWRLNQMLYHSDVPWKLGHFRAPDPALFPAFFLLLALCLATLLPVRAFARALCAPEPPGFAGTTLVVFYAYLSLRSYRFIFDFVVVALPWLVALWSRRAWPSVPVLAALATRIATPVHAASLAGAIAVAGKAPGFPHDPLARTVPRAAARFLEAARIQGTVYNFHAFGGYLGWHLGWPIYWDGRTDVFMDLQRKSTQTRDFDSLIHPYGVDVLVIDPSEYEVLRDYLLAGRPRWGLAYWDDFAAVYLARVPKFAGILVRHEHKIFEPFGYPTDVVRIAGDAALRERARSDLARVLQRNPATRAAWCHLGLIAEATGDLAGAKRDLTQAAGVEPHWAVFIALARVEDALGNREAARRARHRARDLGAPPATLHVPSPSPPGRGSG